MFFEQGRRRKELRERAASKHVMAWCIREIRGTEFDEIGLGAAKHLTEQRMKARLSGTDEFKPAQSKTGRVHTACFWTYPKPTPDKV